MVRLVCPIGPMGGRSSFKRRPSQFGTMAGLVPAIPLDPERACVHKAFQAVNSLPSEALTSFFKLEYGKRLLGGGLYELWVRWPGRPQDPSQGEET